MRLPFKPYALGGCFLLALQGLDTQCQQISAHTLELLRSHADKGDVRSAFTLAMLYAKGEKVGKDWEVSAGWFRKAADAGDVVAEYDLAMLYESGSGVNQDLAEAARWLRQAVAGGDTQTEADLARLDYSGRGVPLNYAEAATLLQDCVKKGAAYGVEFALGILYLEGKGVPHNDAYAFHYFADAAEYDQRAAFNVAVMLFRGQGAPMDYPSARSWANKAMEQMPNNDLRVFQLVKFMNENSDPTLTGIELGGAEAIQRRKKESDELGKLLQTDLSDALIWNPFLADLRLQDEAWTWRTNYSPDRRTEEDLVQSLRQDPGGGFLSWADLGNGNFHQMSFRGVNLRGASLWGATLQDDDFTEANLTKADLDGAVGNPNFAGADLSEADLSGAVLIGSFRNTILRGAKLGGAQFADSDMGGAVYEPAVSPDLPE